MLGEAAGFADLAFTGGSAAIMMFRARLVKVVGSVGRLRSIHVSVSILAVLFIATHIYIMFLPPDTLPVDLGYAATVMGLGLWVTGVGFLERNRDSFFLHGALAVSLVTIVMIHAASSSTTLPYQLAAVSLVAVAGAALANAGYHAKRLFQARSKANE